MIGNGTFENHFHFFYPKHDSDLSSNVMTFNIKLYPIWEISERSDSLGFELP